MKRKFFLLTTVIMFLTVVSVAILYYYYFNNERIRLIDEQIEVAASSLLASDLADSELDEMTDIVAEAIGSDGATTLVSIYTHEGALLYRNENALRIFGQELIPTQPNRLFRKADHHRARFLTLQIGPDRKFLQVGLLLDKGQVHWATLHISALKYVLALMMILLIASITLSRLFMRPIVSLKNHLSYVEKNLGVTNLDLSLPMDLEKKLLNKSRPDEFVALLRSVHELTAKLQNRFRVNQTTAAQMAHELKTPLTILRNCVESVQLSAGANASPSIERNLEEALEEIDHLNRVISNFMDWSRLEHGLESETEIYAISFADTLNEVVEKLNRLNADRVRLRVTSTPTVFVNEDLLRQLIQNILVNALKYSPADHPVECELGATMWTVRDYGPGLSEGVLTKLGQPFNVGEDPQRGSGLGLAWVLATCKRYGWHLEIKRVGGATEVRIAFV